MDRQSILKQMREIGCNDAQIGHATTVADLSLRIADELTKDGRKVDKSTVEVGALLHDVGTARCKGKPFTVPGWPISIQLAEDIIMHVPWSVKLTRDLGYSNSIVRVVQRHDLITPTWLVTREELAELNLKPFSEKDCVPKEPEEKAVSCADFTALMVRIGLNPWQDQKAPVKAGMPYVDHTLQKRTGSRATEEHPIIKRVVALNLEFSKYVKAEFLRT